MSELTQQLAAARPERRLYLLTALPQHLLEAGQSARLRQLANEQGWYQAQLTVDSTLTTYTSFLDSALLASENDVDGLPDSLIISLIQTTARGLVAKLPEPALAALARSGADSQARAHASQRSTPSDRVKALLVVGRSEVDEGATGRARETLDLALAEAERISDPTSRVEALCEIATLMCLTPKDQQASLDLVERAFGLAKSIENSVHGAYSFASIAKAARAIGSEKGWQRAAAAIGAIYAGVTRSREDEEDLDWEAALFAQDFKLLDHPACLVAIAELDHHPSSKVLKFGGELATVVLKAAAHEHDMATCEAIIKSLLTEPNVAHKRVGPELIETLAELGYTDAAVNLIALHLSDDADDLELRQALAMGAGKRGDPSAIIRAAESIKRAGKSTEPLLRAREWALVKSFRAVGRLFDVRETEQVEVLRSGYQFFINLHPRLAPEFLKQVENKFGNQARRALENAFDACLADRRPRTRLLSASIAAYKRFDNKRSRVAALLSAGAEFAIEAEFDRLIRQRQFNEALSLVETLAHGASDPLYASILLEKIALETLALGQADEAARVVELIPDPLRKKSLLRRIAETTATVSKEQSSHIFGLLSSQATQLDEKEQLAHSDVLPVLLTAFVRYEPVSNALSLVESLNGRAVLNALPALGAALGTWHEYELAPRLLGHALKPELRPERRVDALTAMAVDWARVEQLKEPARRAYQLSYELSERLDSYYTDHRARYTDHWARVAHAARALKDRKELESLAKRARRERVWARDELLVHATVGLAAKDVAKHGLHMYRWQPTWFTEMDPYYQVIAIAEVAEEYGEPQPDQRDSLLENAINRLPLHLRLTEEAQDSTRLMFQRKPRFQLKLRFAHHSVNILVRLLRIVSRLDRLDLTTRIVCAAHSPVAVPVLLGEAVRQFVWAKRFEDANRLVQVVEDTKRKKNRVPDWWLEDRAGYDSSFKWHEYTSVPQILLSATLPPLLTEYTTELTLEKFLRTSWSGPTVKGVVEVAARLPLKAARRRIITKILRQAREQGRMEVLIAIEAISSFADAFMSGAELTRLVKQAIATEHWWQQPQSRA